jgi:hypothetical protein
VTLTFKGYAAVANDVTLTISAKNAGTVATGGTTVLPRAAGATGYVIAAGKGLEASSYTVTIDGATSATKIEFRTTANTGGVFFIDDIVITK